MNLYYYLGRLLQVFALVLMPAAIWVAEFKQSEPGAIFIFAGSIVIFFVGWLLARPH